MLMEHLSQILGERLIRNEPIKGYTSLKIGGPADAIAMPSSKQQLLETIQMIRQHQHKFRVVGGGTNLLAADDGFRGVLVLTTQMKHFCIEKNAAENDGARQNYRLYSEAGTRMARLLSECSQKSISGLEFSAGIPGTFGGVLWMNGGTQAGSIEKVVHSIEVIDENGQLSKLPREQINYRYRSCGLYPPMAIVSGELNLVAGDQQQIEQEVARVKGLRKNQPIDWPNAGSIFKNPPGNHAGKLIEDSGLKGKRIGGAMISDRHANFIINTGSASANDVLELITLAQKSVSEKFGVQLETELEVLK